MVTAQHTQQRIQQKLIDQYSYVFIEIVLVDVLDWQAEHFRWKLAHPSRQCGALLQLRVRLWLVLIFLFLRTALLFTLLRQLFGRLFFLSAHVQWPYSKLMYAVTDEQRM